MSGITEFERIFGRKPQYLFSAPGRTEIGGNHTDHQHGCVLAAAVNLETLAWVAVNGERVIRVQSEGYPSCEIGLDDLAVRQDEINTSASLIRGIAAKYAAMGAEMKGFDAYCTSTVLPGSGLSSSAAFEVLMAAIVNRLSYGGKSTPVELAQIGQWAENVYFGKPCGLMDQTASAVGNIIGIDFKDPACPVVERVDFDFACTGYAMCIIDSGADHANLTDEYAAITREMRSVANLFGKEILRDVDEKAFYARIAEARLSCGDRAVLRAMHFFDENRRAEQELLVLKRNDFTAFLQLVRESGRSSWTLLQNVTPCGNVSAQHVAFALALSEHLLEGKGAVRVHGGGFAGTIQAFVPVDMLEAFCIGIESVLGRGSCHALSIRREGAVVAEEYR